MRVRKTKPMKPPQAKRGMLCGIRGEEPRGQKWLKCAGNTTQRLKEWIWHPKPHQVSRRNALVKKASLEETRATRMGGFSPRGPATSRLILAGPPAPKNFLKIFQKGVDSSRIICYNVATERGKEGTPNETDRHRQQSPH